MLEIKIKFLDGVEHPIVTGHGDWVDLQSRLYIHYEKGHLVYIPLGVAMQLPEGYEAHIIPRSSTIRRYGLLHAASGLIDNAYKGDGDEWYFVGYAIRDGIVNVGDRVCQFRVVKKMEEINFIVVDTLGNPDRGGLGSTGK